MKAPLQLIKVFVKQTLVTEVKLMNVPHVSPIVVDQLLFQELMSTVGRIHFLFSLLQPVAVVYAQNLNLLSMDSLALVMVFL